MSSSIARTIGVAPTIWTALRCYSIALMALSSAPGADEVDALDLGHVDRRRSRDCRRIPCSFASCAACDPVDHAVPGQRFGVAVAAASRLRRRPARRGRRPVRGGDTSTRRLPGRRRHLERHRVVDGAVVEHLLVAGHCSSSSDSSHDPSPPSRPRLTASRASAQAARRAAAQRKVLAARFAQRVGEQPRPCVVETRDRGEVEARLRHVLLRSRASSLRAAAALAAVSLPVMPM